MASGSNGKKSRGVYSSLQALIDSTSLTGGTSVWVHGGARYDIYNTDPGDGIQLANGSWAKESQATGGSGEINTGSNIGTGEGIFAQKSGVDLQLKSIKTTGGLSVSSDADSVTVDGSSLIPISDKGVANGIATLQGDGKIPSSQLPSYVDDVLEYPTFTSFPVSGESGKIYVALDTNTQYRWSGSTYVAFGSGSTPWGAITGTLANQTDLQQALDNKADEAPDVGTGETKQYVRQVAESGGNQTKTWVEAPSGGGGFLGFLESVSNGTSTLNPLIPQARSPVPLFNTSWFNVFSSIAGASVVDSDTIELPAGTYKIDGSISAERRNNTGVLLFDIWIDAVLGDSFSKLIIHRGGFSSSSTPFTYETQVSFSSYFTLTQTSRVRIYAESVGANVFLADGGQYLTIERKD